VHIYTGNGKGKTTAAMGLALRALGAGLRVGIVQFAKPEGTSESRALAAFGDRVTFRSFGLRGFVRGEPEEADRRAADGALEQARGMLADSSLDLVVLDEICVAIHLRLLSCTQVVETVSARRKGIEVVLTGRRAPQELLAIADLVTEMKEIKHYFGKGVEARVGIEQ
jgi:cob(I)alamin adenosyltransferase